MSVSSYALYNNVDLLATKNEFSTSEPADISEMDFRRSEIGWVSTPGAQGIYQRKNSRFCLHVYACPKTNRIVGPVVPRQRIVNESVITKNEKGGITLEQKP